jgi:hypothetical protein
MGNLDIDPSGLVNKSLTPSSLFFLILKAGVQMEVTRQYLSLGLR